MQAAINRWKEIAVMAKRCMLLSKRNPDTLLTSIMLPALMMVLFVSLFGRLIEIDGTSYANYIVPGVVLQCIGQCACVTAVMVNNDLSSGIVSRFCTLPMKRSSILNGHVAEAFIRSLVTTAVVLFAALLLGVRPYTDAACLGMFFLLLCGSIAAFSYVAVVIGIAANSAEGASALSALVVILPYISSGFVPVDTLPPVMRVFAKYQPMTPIVDAIRSAFFEKTLELDVCGGALAWCAGLSVLFFGVSAVMFRKKVS